MVLKNAIVKNKESEVILLNPIEMYQFNGVCAWALILDFFG